MTTVTMVTCSNIPYKGRTITLKVKTASFEVRQRSHTLPHPIGSYEEIHRIARGLVMGEMRGCYPSPLNLRLMGE